MSLTRLALLAALSLVFAGCSKDGDSNTFINSLFRGSLDVNLDGGTGTAGTGGVGGDGGSLDVTAVGSIYVGVNPAPLAPELPSAPENGTPIGNWVDTLNVNAGNAIINGNVTADTSGFTATLNVPLGDLVINGTLTAGDNGGTETDIVLNVPTGTVWIAGTIRLGRVDGVSSGDSSGFLLVIARRIIFTGTIEGRGEDGGGGGAFVTFDTESATGQTSQFLVGGTMNLQGGNDTGASAVGGGGGGFFTYDSTSANGAIHIHDTTILCDGGDGTGTGLVGGGPGGIIDLQADGGVFFNATFYANGGSAFSSTDNAIGGLGGTFQANNFAITDSGPVSIFGSVSLAGGPASGASGNLAFGTMGGTFIVLSGSDVNLGTGALTVRGGDASANAANGGTAFFSAGVPPGFAGDIYFDTLLDVSDGSGGQGVLGPFAGHIDFDTIFGDIQISGTLLANGGDGSDEFSLTGGPSDGGAIDAGTAEGGSITIRGTLQANGGSDSDPGDDNDGGDGGTMRLLVSNASGSIYLDPGSVLEFEGGDAGGFTANPFGGNGGVIELFTSGGSIADGISGGNINLRGAIRARGGAGRNVIGSFGGFGGSVTADSDSGFAFIGGADGRAGDITLHPGSTIDASGGPAGSGGDGLNNGAPGVTTPRAVTLDADGNDSNSPSENGIVLNQGTIVARGTGFGAIGGDVLFDGLDAAFGPGPPAGILDLFGDGALGEFLTQ